MKVLVTGANGFLGNHIVKTLLDQGYQVRAFILDGTPEDVLKDLAIEVYKGNLMNLADIEKALDSCDFVIHTAAITDLWPTKNEISWKINFEVAKNIAKAVKQKSIKKYIHVGTANSFGFGTKNQPGTEESEFNCGKYKLDYINSKKAAQEYLLAEQKENGLPVVIINPTFMIGENDSKPGTGEMIISVLTGKVSVYTAGGRCFASVKDVAHGAVNALKKGRVGECYITGGTNLNYKEFFTLIGKIGNVKPPKRKIPTFLVITFAAITEFIASIRKKKPLLTKAMARMSGDGHYYSSDKAIRELDFPQTSLENALSEAIEWYIMNGYIK